MNQFQKANLEKALNIDLNSKTGLYHNLVLNDRDCEDDVEKACGLIHTISNLQVDDDLVEKALDISRLRRVRQMITRRDGTVYMKTVYKKLEEVDEEKRNRFNKQLFAEKDSQVGDTIHLNWTGSATGTTYETDNATIVSISDKVIRVKLTAPFETHNRTNYTYETGYEFVIPRVETSQWDGKNTISKIEVAPTIATIAPSSNREVHSVDEVRIGDVIEITQGSNVRKGTVTYKYLPREGVEYQSSAGRTAKLKVKFEDGSETYVNPASSKNTVRIVSGEPLTNQSPTSFEASIPIAREMGAKIFFPGTTGKVKIGTEEYQARVSVDRFGNENPRGRMTAFRTRTRDVFRDATPEERLTEESTAITEVKATYNNLSIPELITDLKSAFEGSPLGDFDVNKLRFSFGRNGLLEMSYSTPEIEMTRRFSKDGDSLNVYHAYLRITSEAQGSGMMKKIFKALDKQYAKLDIHNISVTANIDVGGYTWAKTGFRCSEETALTFVRKMRDNIGRSKTISKTGERYTITREDASEAMSRYEAFYTTNDSSVKFPMRLLASINGGKAGKALLLHTQWKGSINLRDPQQKNDFQTYINNA